MKIVAGWVAFLLAVIGIGVSVEALSPPHAAPAAVATERVGPVPAGWQQIDVGLGQISVPPSWVVEPSSSCVNDTSYDQLVVGITIDDDGTCGVPLSAVPRSQTIMWISGSTAPAVGRPERSVNGFQLYADSDGSAQSLLVPRLGVEIDFIGEDPTAVLRTLGWSPLVVVLAPGPRRNTPRSWRRLSFDGVEFSVPSSWPVDRPLTLGCDNPFWRGPFVGLGMTVLPIGCPFIPTRIAPTHGVIVVPDSDFDSCDVEQAITLSGRRAIACVSFDSEPPQVATIVSPIRSPSVTFELALGTTGVTAQRILGSMAFS
jgi:hypothetical protein